MKSFWKIFTKYLKAYWLQVVMLVVLLLMSIGLRLVYPQIIRYFIDQAQAGAAVEVLVKVGLLFIGVALFQQILAVGSTYVSQNLGWVTTNALRSDLVAHCLRLDMSFHKANRSGEIIERIDGDVTAMFNFFSNLLVELLGHVLLMCGVIVLLFLEDWRIGLSMSFFMLFAFFVVTRIHTYAVPKHSLVREITTRFYGFLGEVLDSREDIAASGAEGKIVWRFREILRQWWPLQLRAVIATRALWASTIVIFAIGNSLAFGLGGVLWSKGLITLGTVFLIFKYTEMLSMPLSQIQRQLVDLQKADASFQRINELFHTESRLKDGKGGSLPEGQIHVEIRQVSFEYEEGLPVVRNLSLDLASGKVLGVLGRTGSGKTTLARLLTRFYDVTTGEICLNGQLIQSIPLADLRKQIGFVTQDVQLFKATVRDNLTFYNKEISDEQIWEALEEIGLAGWVKAMPSGLDTVLSTDGGGMSAGEAQLLAFVRVFLKKPGLIILDEASSRLDPLTEQLMEGAIDTLFRGRTGIIIAHRLQTIERADQILIVEQGQVREFGDRVELLQDKDSYFSNLLQKGIEEVLA